MTKQFHNQLYRHEPENDIFGDCYRTCFANMFGLEPWKVPHFMVSTEPDFGYDKWVQKQGLKIMGFYCDADMDSALWILSDLAPGEIFIFSGMSSNGVNHAVLAKDGEIIHDPSQDNSGIIGPLTGSDKYMGEFLIKELTPEMQNVIDGVAD